MTLEPKNTDLSMYADASAACARGKTMNILKEKLKMATDQMWCDGNRIVINDDKAKSVLIINLSVNNCLSPLMCQT